MLDTVARTLLALAFTAGASSLLVLVAAPGLAGTPPDAGVLATVRTVLLALAAAGLARAGRTPQFLELGWVAWVVLAAGGIKILVEDFPASSPSTLFVALAAYGAALIVVPKISRPR
jgi:hypothetical protein